MTVIKGKWAPSWFKDCVVSAEGGSPLSIYANALIGLQKDPLLEGMLGFDEFANNVVVLRELEASAPLAEPRQLEPSDIGDIQAYLQHTGLRTLNRQVLHHAIRDHASKNRFHPIRDFLESLTWDGVKRVPSWLAVYAGTAMTEYEMAVGQMFLVSMIARVYQPGCKADHMLVLEGEQGKLKSTLFDHLASPWFSDDLPAEIGSKDAKIHLRGKWLIEVAEMHAFSRAEATQLKSFLSRREERYRPPYAEVEVVEARQCVFAGTTNKDSYLKDETGNRRFWPVKAIERIQTEAMWKDRDQLLAEALALHQAGASWWAGPEFEAAYIQPQQEQRYDGDAWEDPVGEYLAIRRMTDISLTDIATSALGFDGVSRFGTADQNRLKVVLRKLGWERNPERRSGSGRTLWRYRGDA